jgi:para-nitrobenzyl esterase
MAHDIHSARALLTPLVGLLGIAVATACGSSGGGAVAAHTEAGTEAGGVTNSANDSNSMCQATITQGGLKGKSVGATCEYLGVPYGAPPIGAQRFMPPQAAPGWSAPRDATAFGPSCLQAGSTLGSVGATSEDCLTVNVFTPQAAPATPLPVMVFIYGGAFTSGSSTTYDGQGLSERGPVVLVTMNYRLGALGFLALPELDSQRPGAPSGSDGIRDQQLALKWVQDNIAIFHGDKTNVTVFGESAGSSSTCIHIVSPGSQGLASRFIMESFACVGQAAELATQAQAYQVGNELAASFCSGGGDGGAADGGVFDAAAPGVVACLRAADPMMLSTWLPPASAPVTGASVLVGNLLGPPFTPTVEGPGGVLPDTPANIIASGKFNKDAAIMAGSNHDEWGLFVTLASSPAFGGSSSSPLNVTTTAQLSAGITKLAGTQAPQIEALYPSTDATAAQVSIDLWTDFIFRCPTRRLARALMAQGTKDYYLYTYDIGKAWHAFELVPLFNLSALVALGATAPSSAYTQTMQGYWTQFAATGNPNGPEDAGSPTWPSYTAATDQYLELLDPTPMVIPNLRKMQCDFWDSFVMPTSM